MSLYLASLALGGVLLAVSALGLGHGEADADHGELDGDHDVHGAILPFLSLRFWVFALTFFGATGALLSWLALAAPLAIGILAGSTGLATGYVASRVLASLRHDTVGVLPSSSEHVGREGKLLLPVAPGQRGKLRLLLDGRTVDLTAEVQGEQTLPIGADVIVVEVRDATAVVAPVAALTEKSSTRSDEGDR